jgi:hypothetical protein
VTARFLYISVPSAKMYSGDSQYKREGINNGKEKQEMVSMRCKLAYGISAVDGISTLC